MLKKYLILFLLFLSIISCVKEGETPVPPGVETGTLTIYAKSDLGVGNISVYLDNQIEGTILRFHANGVTCGNGDVNIEKPDGSYSLKAESQSGTSWNGTISIFSGQCQTLELTKSASSGGGGSTTCPWTSMISSINVINTQFGAFCNSKSSFVVNYKNTSNVKLITAICFKLKNGTWGNSSDYGIAAGATGRIFICDNATGEYKLYAMKYSDFAGCSFPKCN